MNLAAPDTIHPLNAPLPKQACSSLPETGVCDARTWVALLGGGADAKPQDLGPLRARLLVRALCQGLGAMHASHSAPAHATCLFVPPTPPLCCHPCRLRAVTRRVRMMLRATCLMPASRAGCGWWASSAGRRSVAKGVHVMEISMFNGLCLD